MRALSLSVGRCARGRHHFDLGGIAPCQKHKATVRHYRARKGKTPAPPIVGSINVDCSNGELDPMTNAFIPMSGVFAELELRIIRACVVNGMGNTAAKGAKIGRPQTTLDDIPANFLRHYPAYKNGAFNLTELARLCSISRTTAYKYLGLLER